MFAETLDKTRLRQGDILEGLYCPISRIDKADDSVKVLSERIEPSDERTGSAGFIPIVRPSFGFDWLTAQIQVTRGFCIVLSQNCDLIPRDNGRLDAPGFVV